MTTATATAAAGRTSTGVRPDRTDTPGRTRVTARALSRVVAALTAEELDVDADHVHVDLEDRDGALAAILRTPIGVRGLDADDAPSLVERCSAAQRTLRDRVPALTGRHLAQVTLHLTGAVIRAERRVR
ncbi:hypothetical protein DEI93_14500 [Curtobacterium sp. MCBD17_035]|uniref:hypothetical protein n=1 Tax=Curtobacterium sp. MCBD17_035 TaxID=2175673 RepID=UPI000DA7CA81|nr:hypothetical protein [Curtobacterium sp. MCBD17_035]WIB67147.1 hypothetical protein DEI93_14500 [Curtobacterium sp. MCBD17_035]